MKLLKNLWEVINSRIFLLAIIVGIMFFLLRSCGINSDLERQRLIDEQNISALTDSLHKEKGKNGDLVITINGYISSVKNLEDLNKSLFDEVKNQKGQVLSLNEVIIRLKQDKRDLQRYIDSLITSFGDISQLDDSTFQIPWQLGYTYDSTSYDIFQGQTLFQTKKNGDYINLGSQMLNRETQIKMVFGQKVVNKKLKVFVTSDYPGFNVQGMQGVLIDPNNNPYIKELIEKRHWFSGFSIGVGISPGFNVVDQKFGLVVGPTFNWNIYEF